MQKIIKNLFFVLVCACLLAPLFVFKDLLFPYVTSKAFLFRIGIELALPFYVYLLVSDPKLRPSLKNPLTISVLAFLIINIASSFAGVSAVRSLFGNFERMGGSFYLAHLCALYFYILALGQMPGPYLSRFLKFLLATAAAVTINGIFGWLHLPTLVQDPSLPGRVSSTFGNPIYLGSYLVIPLFLALFFARRAESLPKALGYYFLGFLFLVGIFLSGTRGALVGIIGGSFIAALAYLFFCLSKKIKLYGFMAVGIFVVLSAVLFVFNNKLPQGSTVQRIFTLKDSNTSARLIQWKIALTGYKDRWLLGTGPENYYIVANKYYNPEIAKYDRSWFDKPHNYLLEILVTNGALGLWAYLAMLLFTAAALYKGYKAEFYGLLEFAFLLGAFLAYQIQNLTVFDTVPASLMFYSFYGFAGYLWGIAGKSLGQAKQEQKVEASGVQVLPLAAFCVALMVMAYSVYATEIIPLRISKNINYGYAYASVDANKSYAYFKTAISLPFNFDKTETAGKFAEFASGFIRGAQAKDQAMALEALNASTASLLDAITVQPDYPILWQRLAGLYLFRSTQVGGKTVVDPQAIEAAERAIDLAPKREEGYLTLAQIQALQGKYPEAEKLLQNTIAVYPMDAYVKVQLASIYRTQGKTEEAAKLVDRALVQGYSFGSYGEIKWLIDYHAKNKNFDQALALQLKAAKVEPNNLQVFVDLAHLYALAGHNEEAKNLAEGIIKFDKTKTEEMQTLIDSLPKTASTTPAQK